MARALGDQEPLSGPPVVLNELVHGLGKGLVSTEVGDCAL